MIANYHTHTYRCHHASGEEREYIERAIEAGLKILGFSDHTAYPFPGDYCSSFRMRPEKLDDYFQTLTDLKREYASQIEIHIGVEAEYYPAYFGKLQELLRQYPLEYMLLGQHFLGNEIGDPYSGQKTWSVKRLRAYCDQVIEAMELGCFTYVAHPDLFCFQGEKSVYRAEMRRICQASNRLGIPLEVNFLGFQEGRNYPAKKFWELAGEEHCAVILGCDAHAPEDVWRPDTLETIRKRYLAPFSLSPIETCRLRNPFL